MNQTNMSNQLIKVFLIINVIITGIKTELLENYKLEDVDREANKLHFLKNYIEESRELRESGDSQEWPGRWMPERPDPTPPPKVFYNSALEYQNSGSDSNDENTWLGRWMPERPSDPTPPPKVFHVSEIKELNHGTDSLGRIPMGVKIPYCDDGKTNLTVDWDHSPVNYTCYGQKIRPEYRINPHVYCEKIPPGYVAMHRCMQDVIEYDDDIPLYGTHRPIWPIYGEYKFVPKQRWLHNMEHGAVVMLYHPCANPLEVKRLRELVTGCIRRHIITPSNLLDIERPLALLTWGCRLSMSYVDPKIVHDFIIEKALKGPEAVERDGDFKEGLFKKAEIVSDIKDSILCPNLIAQYSQDDDNGKSM